MCSSECCSALFLLGHSSLPLFQGLACGGSRKEAPALAKSLTILLRDPLLGSAHSIPVADSTVFSSIAQVTCQSISNSGGTLRDNRWIKSGVGENSNLNNCPCWTVCEFVFIFTHTHTQILLWIFMRFSPSRIM